MLKITTSAIIGLSFSLVSNSSLAVEPSVGVGATVSITRELLSAPTLPDLESDKTSVTPQIGYASIKKDRTEQSPDGVSTSNGEIKGPTAGLGLTIPTKGDLGFFIFTLGSKVGGDITSFYNGSQTEVDRDISAQSYSAVAGISYRFIGDAKSAIALGLFAGPSISMIRSSMTIDVSVTTDTPTKISVNPTLYGAYEGIQLKLRLANFLVNPYFVLGQDLNDPCQKINVESGSINFDQFTCGGKTGYLNIDSSLFGFGVFLGYGPVRFNVYSQNITKMLDETATTYSLSYSINLP